MLSFICLLFLIGQGGTQPVYHEDYGNLTAVDSSNPPCPGPWSISENINGSTRCQCGSQLHGMVQCNDKTLQVKLLPCYCMTPYAKDPNITVVGACLYRCIHSQAHKLSYMCKEATSYETELRNRDGQLCGKCTKGFAPPVYSYDPRCVNCSHSEHYTINSVKYCIIAFLPLTSFFIALVTLRISATSPLLNAFVLVCQVLASPLQVGLTFIRPSTDQKPLIIVVGMVISLFGFWNLDFFRTLYPPFCLHPNVSTLQVLALDYTIAAYPLLLIVITYCLVELHDRNCKIVVLLWKPFHRCFARFHRQWDIRTSLIEAFASFLLLSYVKFLNVSLYFLLPVYLYNVHGDAMGPYLYYDGTVEYFGKQHLPYAILAIAVLTTFIILPLLLLCLYPCQRFQKILNFYGLRCQALHTFMDALQGYYKNGTNGTRDCRYLSAVYLFVRIIFFVITAVSLSFSVVLLYFLSGILFSLFVILIAVVQPYKYSSYSIIDILLILVIALFYFSAMGHRSAHFRYEALHRVTGFLQFICGVIPLIYITIIILRVFFKRRIPQQWCSNLLNLPFCKRLIQNTGTSEEPLPDRLANPEECAALLHGLVSDDQDTDDASSVPSFEL